MESNLGRHGGRPSRKKTIPAAGTSNHSNRGETASIPSRFFSLFTLPDAGKIVVKSSSRLGRTNVGPRVGIEKTRFDSAETHAKQIYVCGLGKPTGVTDQRAISGFQAGIPDDGYALKGFWLVPR